MPAQVLSLTPREFTILMRTESEVVADRFERMASMAIMNRAAYHAKKLKHSDLYNRKDSKPSANIDELKAETKRAQSFLDSLVPSSQAEGVRE